MQADLPHVLYNTEASESSPEKKNTVASDEVMRLQEEANRKMMERKATENKDEESYELNELFN